jgi:four helix bundle protein
MADKLEELPIHDRALEFCRAVTAILQRPAVRDDCDLWEQINKANDSILANMSEGFEQSTDAHFANYLYIAKGSLAEVLTRLKQAEEKKHITASDRRPLKKQGEELGRMLGGFIRYLGRSGFKNRGRHNGKQGGSQGLGID